MPAGCNHQEDRGRDYILQNTYNDVISKAKLYKTITHSVGSQLVAQTQKSWVISPMSSIQ